MNPHSIQRATPSQNHHGTVNGARKRTLNDYDDGEGNQAEYPSNHRLFSQHTSGYQLSNGQAEPNHQAQQPSGSGITSPLNINNRIYHPVASVGHQQQQLLSHSFSPQSHPNITPLNSSLATHSHQPYRLQEHAITQEQPINHNPRSLEPPDVGYQQHRESGNGIPNHHNNAQFPFQSSPMNGQHSQHLSDQHTGPEYSNNSTVNHPPFAPAPEQLEGLSDLNFANNPGVHSPGPLAYSHQSYPAFNTQQHHLPNHQQQPGNLNGTLMAAAPSQPLPVHDNQQDPLDNGNFAGWNQQWDQQQLEDDLDQFNDFDLDIDFLLGPGENIVLPEGGIQVPVQEPQADQSPNNLQAMNTPENEEPPEQEVAGAEASEDEASEGESDDDSDNDDEAANIPEQPVQPAAQNGGQNANLLLCDVPGCGLPRYYQTTRSRKCRDHLEAPPPASRLQHAHGAEEPTANPDQCPGCNGLRPRRAPRKLCWECYCKSRRYNFGVCDGCPAVRCNNHIPLEQYLAMHQG
ncbi:hypothetical protein B0T20DRAFT_478751 [Sordaria brevicollis]|uniref:Uncharacterized protein n=1 Tax=Sordaria brevicollis TaxID=83679 RepID=A0AAE0PG60_SORBR|nr:hypothetical protein B0T20DRAFT_478751 [Sordaria brevicollis]